MLRTLSVILLIVSLLSAACSGGKSQQHEPAKANADRCYELREGQDVAYVRLHLNGNAATGDFLNLPYEKDAAIGTFSGTLKENQISATWKYTQEGMEQVLPVVFRIDGNKLSRQEWAYDPATGEAKLDPNGKFAYVYSPVDCAKLPAK